MYPSGFPLNILPRSELNIDIAYGYNLKKVSLKFAVWRIDEVFPVSLHGPLFGLYVQQEQGLVLSNITDLFFTKTCSGKVKFFVLNIVE